MSKNYLSEKEIADLMYLLDGYLVDILFRSEMENDLYTELKNLENRIQDIRHLSAPLFFEGKGLGGIARRILNIPIRIFGRKQRAYNSDLLDLLEETISVMERMLRYLALQEIEINRLKDSAKGKEGGNKDM